MDQSHGGHGGRGGFDPAQLDNGGWGGDFVNVGFDPGQFPYELAGNSTGNVNFPSNQAASDHRGLHSSVVGTEFGNYPGQYIQSNPHHNPAAPAAPAALPYSPQQLAPSYHQPPLQFDVGHPSRIQTSGTPNGLSQGFAARRNAAFNLPQNGYSPVATEAQSPWQGHPAGQMVNGYQNHPSYASNLPLQNHSHPLLQNQLEQQPLQKPAQNLSPRVAQPVSHQAMGQALPQATQLVPQQDSRQPVPPPSKAAPPVKQASRPTGPMPTGPMPAGPVPTGPVPAGPVPAIQNHAGQHHPHHLTSGTPQASGSPTTIPDQYLKVDDNLAKLREETGVSWVGAKHLVVESAPEPRERISRTTALVPCHIKQPLFPQRSFPLPAETLGRHLEGRVAIAKELKDDPAAFRAKQEEIDAIMVQELKRNEHTVPEKWKTRLETKVKEELKRCNINADAATQNQSDLPTDKIREVELETTAILHIAPGCKPDAVLIARITDDFCSFLRANLVALRTTEAYKELPKAIRENNRKPSQAAQEKIRVLKGTVDPLRKAVERIVAVALEKGDARVLRSVGQKKTYIGPLFQTAINCINSEETNSPLVKVILHLFTHFTTISTSQLEECKVLAARTKLQDLGDDEVKSALAKILAMAKENDGKVSSNPAKPSSQPSAETAPKAGKTLAKPSLGSKPTSSLLQPAKRPRDDDNELRASKKVATETRPFGAHLTTKGAPSKASSSPSQPSTATLAKPRPSTGLLPGKSRPPPKPAQKLDSLKAGHPKPEASRTPASSDSPPDSVLSKSEMPKVKKPETSKSEAPQQSQSKFAALMAEIAEPKKAKPPSPTPPPGPDLDETPKERDRRLRKEERRRQNLRVSWKEGDELASVRIFHKEAEEDEGREVSMIRDAGDDRAEGKLLKQSRSGEIRPWEEPGLIDFGKVSAKREDSFVTRGGIRSFHTDQQKFMEERESKELMVVYTDPDDIPPTPKSPPPQPAEPSGPEGAVHTLPTTQAWDALRQRTEDTASLGPAVAARRLLQRIAESKRGSTAEEMVMRTKERLNAANPHLTPEARDREVFNLLSGPGIKQWREPDVFTPAPRKAVYDDPKVQRIFDNIAAIVESLKDKPAPSNEPPDWQQDPERRAEWWKGYNQDKQRKEEHDKQQRAREAASQPTQSIIGTGFGQYTNPAQPYTQPQNAYSQYYPAAQPAQPSVQPQQPGMGSNEQVNAMLAALASHSQQVPQSNFAQQPTTATDATRALLATLNQSQQQPPPLSQAPPSGVLGNPNLQDPNQAQTHLLLAQLLAGQQNHGVQGGQAGGETHPYGSTANQGGNDNQLFGGTSHGFGQDHHQSRHQLDGSDPSARGGQGNRGRDKAGHGGRRGQSSAAGQGDVPEHLRNINRSLIGTKQCTFWARGQCAKGDSCTFRHSYT